METLKSPYKFFDIAANMCDDEFQGIYHEKKYHESDVDEVLKRAKDIGVEKFLFGSGSLNDTKISYELSQKDKNYYITCGIHPCRATETLKLYNNDISEIFIK